MWWGCPTIKARVPFCQNYASGYQNIVSIVTVTLDIPLISWLVCNAILHLSIYTLPTLFLYTIQLNNHTRAHTHTMFFSFGLHEKQLYFYKTCTYITPKIYQVYILQDVIMLMNKMQYFIEMLFLLSGK